jgi:hypothetical protein
MREEPHSLWKIKCGFTRETTEVKKVAKTKSTTTMAPAKPNRQENNNEYKQTRAVEIQQNEGATNDLDLNKNTINEENEEPDLVNTDIQQQQEEC